MALLPEAMFFLGILRRWSSSTLLAYRDHVARARKTHSQVPRGAHWLGLRYCISEYARNCVNSSFPREKMAHALSIQRGLSPVRQKKRSCAKDGSRSSLPTRGLTSSSFSCLFLGVNWNRNRAGLGLIFWLIAEFVHESCLKRLIRGR